MSPSLPHLPLSLHPTGHSGISARPEPRCGVRRDEQNTHDLVKEPPLVTGDQGLWRIAEHQPHVAVSPVQHLQHGLVPQEHGHDVAVALVDHWSAEHRNRQMSPGRGGCWGCCTSSQYRAPQLPRSFNGQVAADGLGSPYGCQLRIQVKEAADPFERGGSGRADLVEVEPGVLVAKAGEISPSRVLSEDELELHLPVLRLPIALVRLADLSHSKLPPEGQRRLVVVPVPPAPLDDEAVAVVLGRLDPCNLDLKEFTEGVPRCRDITHGVGLDSTLLQYLREHVGAGSPRNGHAGCYLGGSHGQFGRSHSDCGGGSRAACAGIYLGSCAARSWAAPGSWSHVNHRKQG